MIPLQYLYIPQKGKIDGLSLPNGAGKNKIKKKIKRCFSQILGILTDFNLYLITTFKFLYIYVQISSSPPV